MAFDPNLPNDTKRGLKNRPAPSLYDSFNNWAGSMINKNAPPGESAASASQFGPQAVANFAATGATSKPAATVAAPAPNSQVELDPSDAGYPHGEIQGNGLKALPQGVVRSSIPGVYIARGKDGSFMASNVMGAAGAPDFGGGAAANAAAAGVKSLRRPGGTSYDPRMAITDAEGYTMAPGAQGGAYDPNAGVVDASGAGSLLGAASGPHAGFTYAQNSLRMNPADMITAAGINPEAAQDAKRQLIAAMNNDPNSTNPEVQAANRAALAQLQGNEQDVRQQYFGGNGSMYGAMGGVGGTGAAGGRGIGLKDVLMNRYRNANLAERTQRDQATDQYREQMADRADRAEARQGAQYFMTNYQNAENKLPGSGDSLIAQTTPQGLSPDEFKKWVTTNPAGQAWSTALKQSMQRGAAQSLKTPFDIPIEWGDKANLASNVNFGNMKLDKNGDFAGFYDNSDAPTNEYPRRSGLWGSPNYNEALLRTISPAYWKVLQQIGLHRSQPASGG